MKLAVCVFVLISSVSPKNLPSYFPICKISQTDFNLCMMKATVSIRPYIAKGIKELNIPAVEPLEIPMVKLEQGTGAVNYKATLTNIKIYGLSNYHFHNITSDFSKKFKMHGNVDLPFITLDADYVISGRALVVPIQGNGLFTANITNCKAEVKINADLVRRKMVEYLQIRDTSVKLELGGAMAHFENLFNGDEFLSQTTNAFVNENARDLIIEVKPAVEAVAGMLIDDIAGKILKTLPYEKLFPK